MREYELMVIFHPELDTPALQAAFDGLKAKLEQLGTLTAADILGDRRLAYEVRKCHKGTFGLMNFTCEPGQLTELRRYMQIDQRDQIIRHLLLIDEKRGSRPPSQPLPGSTEPKPEEELSEKERMAQAAAERAALEEQARQTVDEPAAEAVEAAPAPAAAGADEAPAAEPVADDATDEA